MTPTKTISPEEIAKKLNEAKPEERAAILTQIASEHGAAPVAAPAPVITFSPEEQKRLVDGIVNQSAKLIGDKAAEVSREYKLPHGEAVAMVEDAASRSAKERNLKRQKYGIIAKRLATSLRPNGIGSDDYKRAAEEEAEFLKKNYGMDRAERAMSLADDTKGGALAPEVMETEVYFHVQQTAIGRRYCEVKEIPLGQEIKKWPKITSDMSAAVKAEAAAGNESDIDTTTFDLNPKAIIALSGPISIDLILASSMNIVEHLISRAAFVFSKQEDRYLFNGDSGVNWNGLLTAVPSGQVVEMAAGEAITDLNPDYLIDMEYKLEDHYIPDPEDVTGSRVTTGEALNWFHRAA